MLYTWKDVFAENLREIRPTDLIEHTIDLKPGATPVKGRVPLYTPWERKFAAKIFPELEQAGIIRRMSSEWGARTKFLPKKKGSNQLHVVHNYIPVNNHTIKSSYPMHRLEEVLETLMRPKFRCFFGADASNGYWAISMKAGHEYKTGFLTPHSQYCYNRMGQGLKGAPHTYSQFTDLIYGPLPLTKRSEGFWPSAIEDHGSCAFKPFIDDHLGASIDFNSMFSFLQNVYLPRMAFGPVYLAPHKMHAFTNLLDLLGFTGDACGLRPSVKHRTMIVDWPTL